MIMIIIRILCKKSPKTYQFLVFQLQLFTQSDLPRTPPSLPSPARLVTSCPEVPREAAQRYYSLRTACQGHHRDFHFLLFWFVPSPEAPKQPAERLNVIRPVTQGLHRSFLFLLLLFAGHRLDYAGTARSVRDASQGAPSALLAKYRVLPRTSHD